MAQVPGLKEVANGCLRSTQLLTNGAAAVRSLSFFQTSRAAGASLSNLRFAGQLPQGEQFEVRGISIGVAVGGIYGAAANIQAAIDVIRVFHQATTTLTVQTKPHIDAWPLDVFNIGWNLPGGANQLTTAGSYYGSGDPTTIFRLPHTFTINANESFGATIDWDVSPSAGLVSSQTITYTIFGTHIRTVG